MNGDGESAEYGRIVKKGEDVILIYGVERWD